MATLNMVHEINCDEETFWKVFFDKDFNQHLFLEALQFPKYEILEQKESEQEIFRKVSAQPKMDAPAAVQKLLGPSFGYIEEGRLDRSSKIWRWHIIPSAMANKIKQEGTMRIEKSGEGRVRRITDLIIEVKVFGIGGMIEKTASKTLQDGWDKSVGVMNQWIAEGKHK